jgi:MFS family permease
VAARRVGDGEGCGKIGVAALGRSAGERLDLRGRLLARAGGGCLHSAVHGGEATDHGDDFQPGSGAELGTGARVIADRVDRRRLMVTVDTARAAIIAGLAAAVLTHEAGLVLIYVAAFLVGTGAALRGTAAVASVPRLVEPTDLDKANGRVIAGQIVGNELVGPAAGGWLFGMAAVPPFAVNAGTLGIAVLLLLTLPGVFAPPPRQHEPGTGRARFLSVRHDLAEALGWMQQDPAIRDITLMAGVVAAMDATWFAVLVLYVIKVLHQQPGTYGLLLAIGAAGGILAGSGGAVLTRRIGPSPAGGTAPLLSGRVTGWRPRAAATQKISRRNQWP